MYTSFPLEMVDSIKCQRDAGGLAVRDADIVNDRIVNGALRCHGCGAEYHIEQGILDLMPFQNPLDNISIEEIKARDREAEIYEKIISDLSNRMETGSFFRHFKKISYKNIIEFGCGTGRFTVELLKHANQIIAVDFSKRSLHILARKLGDRSDIGLVLADAVQICIAHGRFDMAVSLQVLEHIPTRSQRNKFLSKINESLVPNGVFLCTAYHRDIKREIRKEPFEGYHPSKIFYHRFSIAELKKEVSAFFKKAHIHPIHIELPFIRRFPLSDSYIAYISMILEHIPILNKFGQLILVKAWKY